MALNQILNDLFKTKFNSNSIFKLNKLSVLNIKSAIILTAGILLSLIFLVILNEIDQKKVDNKKNFEAVTNSSEFGNFKNFLVSKINSPYQEKEYLIQRPPAFDKRGTKVVYWNKGDGKGKLKKE